MSRRARPVRRRRTLASAVIDTRGLTKFFGPVHAVEGLDLEVRRGEVFGYLGPNGAGKTTTIRLLLDFIRPTAGEARVLGGSGADPEVRRRIGYLPGDLKLDARYTSDELFSFYGALRGNVDRSYRDELVERFELDPTRKIGELSSGNRRKVGIVQAFLHKPELLVLDEPTSGLDPLLQREFQQLVHERATDGATVFLSSHVLHEVDEMADRVAILRKGRLVKLASIHQLRQQARQHIDLHFEGKANAEPFARVPEVIEAHARGNSVHLVVEGSVERVLRTAARLHAHRIVSPEADLEDVFLAFYQDDEL
ncbi:MAG: ABC transporter ATP-binding protein [Actinomycetota bacterium]